jgi:hypothetical protein
MVEVPLHQTYTPLFDDGIGINEKATEAISFLVASFELAAFLKDLGSSKEDAVAELSGIYGIYLDANFADRISLSTIDKEEHAKAKKNVRRMVTLIGNLPKSVRTRIAKRERYVHKREDSFAAIEKLLQIIYVELEQDYLAPTARLGRPRRNAENTLVENIYYFLSELWTQRIPRQTNGYVLGRNLKTDIEEEVFPNLGLEAVFYLANWVQPELQRSNVSSALRTMKSTRQK